MKQIRIPSFVQNLFRDLRDRRLLLPALLLVVALFAVPILLKSHSSTDRASTASIGGSGDGTMRAVPAVVAQQVGVTNYRKRLNQLQSKNPFHQQYTATPDSSSAPKLQASTGTTSTGTAGTVSSGTDTSSSSGPVSSVAGSTSPGSAPVSSSPPQSSSGGGSNSAAPGHHTNPGVRYYAWRVSVKVGEPGHLKERAEVQRLAMLPSEGKPAATFLGATEEGGKALFLVSSDVDSVNGDGRCLPSHSSCRYLVLKPGEKANLHYAPNNKRYNVVLVDIHPVDVTDKLPKKPSGKAQPQQKLPLLGDG